MFCSYYCTPCSLEGLHVYRKHLKSSNLKILFIIQTWLNRQQSKWDLREKHTCLLLRKTSVFYFHSNAMSKPTSFLFLTLIWKANESSIVTAIFSIVIYDHITERFDLLSPVLGYLLILYEWLNYFVRLPCLVLPVPEFLSGALSTNSKIVYHLKPLKCVWDRKLCW